MPHSSFKRMSLKMWSAKCLPYCLCPIELHTIWFIFPMLTHLGRVTHICVSKLTNLGSDNGLLPHRRQAIIWTNAGILLLGPLGTNSSDILIGIQSFSFRKMHLKISSAKWRPFCLGLNELMIYYPPSFCMLVCNNDIHSMTQILNGCKKNTSSPFRLLISAWAMAQVGH